MLHGEKVLLATLRTSLRKMFEDVPATFECDRSVIEAFVKREDAESAESSLNESSSEFSLVSLKRSFSSSLGGQSSRDSTPKRRNEGKELLKQKSVDDFLLLHARKT